MSAKTLGTNLNVPEHVAQGYIDSLFGQFPTLEKFIQENSEYPMKHGGLINTELGDRLKCSAYRFLYKDNPRRPGQKILDNRVVAKLGSAGINYRIQSFSAVSLASGFEHVIQEAMNENRLIRNIIVVHDSCENYASLNYLFELKQFYDKNFLQYAKKLYGIFFNYDLEVGLSYGEMMGVKPIDDKTIEVTGTGSTLQTLLWKIENESDLEISCNVDVNTIVPNFEMNCVERFIKDKQCCKDLDESKYTIQLTKLN